MLSSKILKEALAAARKGDTVNLSELTIPWGGGRIAKAEGDAKGSLVRSVIWSDKAVDEDNDTIDPGGWDLNRFLRNGPILWAHDSRSLPLGNPLNTRVEGIGAMGQLLGDVEFTDTYDFANLVLQLVDAGVVRGVSVGFRPIKWLWNEERGGLDFLEQRLLEGSIVPVGSNPNAMIAAAQSKGLDMAPMVEWLERCLDDEDIYTASPRGELEILHKALGPWKKTSAGIVARTVRVETQAADLDAAAKRIADKVDADNKPTPGEIKLTEEATTMLGVMVEAIKAGELSAEIFNAPLACLGLVAESRGAISWDEAHPNGTPRAPKDAEWVRDDELGGGKIASARRIDGFVHHRTAAGHAVVWTALTEAMDNLFSCDIEIVSEPDRRAVYDHIARHYRDDFDEEPPALRAPGEEPPVTTEEIGEMVQDGVTALLKEIQERDGITVAFVEEAVTDAVKKLTREFLRETGRLPA